MIISDPFGCARSTIWCSAHHVVGGTHLRLLFFRSMFFDTGCCVVRVQLARFDDLSFAADVVVLPFSLSPPSYFTSSGDCLSCSDLLQFIVKSFRTSYSLPGFSGYCCVIVILLRSFADSASLVDTLAYLAVTSDH